MSWKKENRKSRYAPKTIFVGKIDAFDGAGELLTHNKAFARIREHRRTYGIAAYKRHDDGIITVYDPTRIRISLK